MTRFSIPCSRYKNLLSRSEAFVHRRAGLQRGDPEQQAPPSLFFIPLLSASASAQSSCALPCVATLRIYWSNRVCE